MARRQRSRQGGQLTVCTAKKQGTRRQGLDAGKGVKQLGTGLPQLLLFFSWMRSRISCRERASQEQT